MVKTDAELKALFSAGQYPPESAFASLIESKQGIAAEVTTPSADVILDENSDRYQSMTPTMNISVKFKKENLVAGEVFTIENNSAFKITLKADDLSVIAELYAGRAMFQTKIAVPPANTNWRVFSVEMPGEIKQTGSPLPIPGSLYCDGSAVSRTTYAALFAHIGTAYGVGDGSTTFNVPDLRGVFIRGLDDTRGIDTGRIHGAEQAEMIGPHSHGGSTSGVGDHIHGHHASGGTAADGQSFRAGGPNDFGNYNNNPSGAHSHSITTDNGSGTENRPINNTAYFHIKY